MDILVECGKIKVREKYFLSQVDIDKLIGAKNFNEFISVLEKSFYKIPSGITSSVQIIDFFEKEREKLIDEIEKNTTEEIYTIFTLKYDFHNLKLLAEKKEEKQMISLYSRVDYYSLKESVEKKDYRKIPEYLNKSIKILSDEKMVLEEKLLKLKKEYY
ncbi:V-type ATPase subunit, partial [bacterium]|nr:V-type ATPase subunit [bacterium]